MFNPDSRILSLLLDIREAENSLCSALSNYCLFSPDDASSKELFDDLRDHIQMGKHVNREYAAEAYLDYLSSFIELVSNSPHRVAPPSVVTNLENAYEFLRMNVPSLQNLLDKVKHREKVDKMRQNYWMN